MLGPTPPAIDDAIASRSAERGGHAILVADASLVAVGRGFAFCIEDCLYVYVYSLHCGLPGQSPFAFNVASYCYAFSRNTDCTLFYSFNCLCIAYIMDCGLAIWIAENMRYQNGTAHGRVDLQDLLQAPKDVQDTHNPHCNCNTGCNPAHPCKRICGPCNQDCLLVNLPQSSLQMQSGLPNPAGLHTINHAAGGGCAYNIACRTRSRCKADCRGVGTSPQTRC